MEKFVSETLTVMILSRQRASPTIIMLSAQTEVRAYKGLSRMRGNLHVRFLGGGGAVMRCCYPTFISLLFYTKKPSLGSVFLCHFMR